MKRTQGKFASFCSLTSCSHRECIGVFKELALGLRKKKFLSTSIIYPIDGYIRVWYIESVIKLRLNEVLEQRGKTLYWLWKQTDIRYATIWQMAKGKVSRLNMDTLDRICEVLECQPGDLVVRFV